MKGASVHPVSVAQWLAVLAIWGLAAYGALATPKGEAHRDSVKPTVCR